MENEWDKKYYTIGQVADILHVTTSTLRFYEKKVRSIQPVRSSTGRRMYRPKDIETLRMVLYLVKDKGLKIDAACEEIRRNPDGILKHTEAIESLKNVRAKIMETLTALHELR